VQTMRKNLKTEILIDILMENVNVYHTKYLHDI